MLTVSLSRLQSGSIAGGSVMYMYAIISLRFLPNSTHDGHLPQ